MPTNCTINITPTSTCPTGGINQVSVTIKALGTIAGVAGGTAAGTVLGTAMDISLSNNIVVTNTTAVDVASAFTASPYSAIVIDQELLPEDVEICATVTDACGTSTEDCDTAIVELIPPVAFFSSTWSTSYEVGLMGTTITPRLGINQYGYEYQNFINLETNKTDGIGLATGIVEMVIDTGNGDTLTLTYNVGDNLQTPISTSATGVFNGNEAVILPEIVGTMSDGSSIQIDKRGIWLAVATTSFEDPASILFNPHEWNISLTIIDDGSGTASSNIDNFTTLPIDKWVSIRTGYFNRGTGSTVELYQYWQQHEYWVWDAAGVATNTPSCTGIRNSSNGQICNPGGMDAGTYMRAEQISNRVFVVEKTEWSVAINDIGIQSGSAPYNGWRYWLPNQVGYRTRAFVGDPAITGLRHTLYSGYINEPLPGNNPWSGVSNTAVSTFDTSKANLLNVLFDITGVPFGPYFHQLETINDSNPVKGSTRNTWMIWGS